MQLPTPKEVQKLTTAILEGHTSQTFIKLKSYNRLGSQDAFTFLYTHMLPLAYMHTEALQKAIVTI